MPNAKYQDRTAGEAGFEAGWHGAGADANPFRSNRRLRAVWERNRVYGAGCHKRRWEAHDRKVEAHA